MTLKSVYVAPVLLVCFFIVGLILRLGLEPKYPQGFHRDEAVITYSAYSILMTGRDEWGNLLPLHFRALGDYPPGIYNYLVALSILIVGYGETAARFPSILAGSFLIPLSYVLIKKWLSLPKVGLLVAFLITVSPWDVVQSRAGSEAIVGLAFFLSSWLCLLKWTEKNKIGWLGLSSLLGFLAMFSYNAIKLGLPLLFTYFVISNYATFKSKKMIIGWLAAWWIIGVGSVFLSQGTAMSLRATSVLETQQTGSLTVGFIREGNSHIPVIASRILHNRIVNVSQNVIKNYVNYFSADFLFWQGGFPGRYKIPATGLIYLVLLPFIFYSLTIKSLLTSAQKKLILGWLLLAPIVAAITNTDVPNVKRALFMFLPLYILAADGWWAIFQAIKHKVVIFAFICVSLGMLTWENAWFAIHYLAHSGYETVHDRSYGWKEVFLAVDELQSKYQKIYIYEDNDAPYIFYLFYSKYSPAEYQKVANQNPTNIFRSDKKTWQLDNLTFFPGDCPQVLEPGILYISPAFRCTEVWKNQPNTMLGQVAAPDGTPKFVWYELKVEQIKN